MCICMYVYMYIKITLPSGGASVFLRRYARLQNAGLSCIYVYVCAYVYVCVCVCMCVCACVCLWVCYTTNIMEFGWHIEFVTCRFIVGFTIPTMYLHVTNSICHPNTMVIQIPYETCRCIVEFLNDSLVHLHVTNSICRITNFVIFGSIYMHHELNMSHHIV